MERKENVVLGVLGAIIGAVAGSLLWILIAQMNVVASIAGLAIIAASIKGYELLGGRLSKAGVILSVLISLVMVYVAEYISVAIVVYREVKDYGMSFSYVMDMLPELLEESEIKAAFIKDLVIGYIFAVIGGGSFVARAFRLAASNDNRANYVNNGNVNVYNNTDTYSNMNITTSGDTNGNVSGTYNDPYANNNTNENNANNNNQW